MQVWRKGSSRQIDVRVGKFSAEKVASSDVPGTEAGRLGVSVRALTPEERRRAEATGSVVVLDVTGAAARAGIQPGDIVLSINGEPITKAEQLRALVEAHARFLVQNPKEFDPRKYLAKTVTAMKDICVARYLAFGCEGQASKIKPISLEKMAEKYAKGELAQIVK